MAALDKNTLPQVCGVCVCVSARDTATTGPGDIIPLCFYVRRQQWRRLRRCAMTAKGAKERERADDETRLI